VVRGPNSVRTSTEEVRLIRQGSARFRDLASTRWRRLLGLAAILTELDGSSACATHRQKNWRAPSLGVTTRANPWRRRESRGGSSSEICSLSSESMRVAFNRAGTPPNNEMQRTKHGPNGASPLISVLYGPLRSA